MGERLAWMQQNKNSFTISYSYADIKSQKISPDSKEKVQLQVVLQDGGANTFHFCNPKGREAQYADRETIKELLQQLLPKFRRKVSSELEQKNRILQQDPELFQLYKDLVVSGVITAEEFWASRNEGKQSTACGPGTKQEVGVSAAFLADIKPQADGCNGLRYNLTADIIESIFRTYPAVKRKHAEYVPDRLSEQEFWTSFFQSHYFHRDRINVNSKDLFAECAILDEHELQKEKGDAILDPLLDLSRMDDVAQGEGYGQSLELSAAASNPCNSSLIKRFNQHSTMVLKACDKALPRPVVDMALDNSTVSKDAATLPGSGVNGVNGAGDSESKVEPPPSKKAKLQEKVEYVDLAPSSSSGSAPGLRLTRLDRYLHGPTVVTTAQYHTNDDVLRASRTVVQEMLSWQPQLTQVLPNNIAASVLGELSPGGALMQGCMSRELHQMVTPDIQLELKHLYNAVCELLRHFWSCFPTTSKSLEEKAVRMKDSLERFQYAKLLPVKEKIQNYHYTVNLVGHLEAMLEAAYNKFNMWQMKRFSKKS
ncbi:General transcription factor IIH subunit 1 [Lamellibrachia satsuma]|nr:General transcription factor IIH subunit 1 [Lamellibrachia satsuma]